MLEMLNFVDSYYKTMDTRVVLSELDIWHDGPISGNYIEITDSGKETLRNLETYTESVLYGEKKLQFDHAHLVVFREWGYLAGMARLAFFFI